MRGAIMHGATPRRLLKRRTAVTALGTLAALLTLSPARAAGVASNHVRDVKVHGVAGAAGTTEIEIVGTSVPTYNARVTDGGKRLVVDLSNADVAGAPGAINSPVGVVGGVLTQSFASGPAPIARLDVSLLHTATYRLKTDGNTLHIVLVPADATAAVDENAPVAAAAAVVPAAAEVRDVRYQRVGSTMTGCAPAGCDRVVVSLSALPAYSLTTGADKRVRLELKSTSIPETLVRELDAVKYKGVIKTVSSFPGQEANTTIIEIDRADDVQGQLSVDGTNLIWSFALPKAVDASAAKGGDGGPVRKAFTFAREDDGKLPHIDTSIRGDGPTVETVGGGTAGFTATIDAQAMRYTGRRVEIDLKDADIHNVLRMLADVGHVNLVVTEEVAGSITLRMHNVPWDQALDVVLQAKGLGMVRQGNLIRVAPLATLQKERELLAARHKAEFEQAPLATRLIPVNYATADELSARAHDMLSPRGSLSVDERTNYIIARDIDANLNHIEELVHQLDLQTPQVLIEARIVEATSSYQRDIGIQWGGDSTMSAATGNPTGVAFPSSLSVAGGNYDNQTPTAGISPFSRQVATPNFAVNLPAAVGTGAGGAIGVSLGSIDNNFNLSFRLSAAESTGLLRVVSAPRVLVQDNREARINQGTLIPFAQVSALGVQTTFQEAKLQLLVRPHVTADGAVAMHVKINRDEPDFTQTSPRGDPTILKREAETDLLIMDGHTAVIGGIYTRNTGRNLNQVPFFGDIPIIGLLFQRRRAADTRGELVIFLTPRIVNRAESMGH
jgi:type IV pilus assembly protein PilQ